MDISSQLLQTGFLLSIFGSLFYSLKSLPKEGWNYLKTRFVYRVHIQDNDPLFVAVEQWLYKHHNSKYRYVQAGYQLENRGTGGGLLSTEGQKRRALFQLIFQQDVSRFMLRWEKKRIFFTKDRKDFEKSDSSSNFFSYSYAVSGYRAKKEINELLQLITDVYNTSIQDNDLMIMSNYHTDWFMASKKKVKPFSSIVMEKSLKDFMLEDIKKFDRSEEWYANVCIPYKRTYALHGEPGTGKTSLALAIASELNRDIHIMNLSSVNSDEIMIKLISGQSENSILLIEDIDAADIRREKKNGYGVSMSCLLNCLDGAFQKHGAITIITTNHLERLDPALIRPGRTDVILEIPYAKTEQISEFLSLFYTEKVELEGELSVPISFVQEQCIRNRANKKEAIESIKNFKKEETNIEQQNKIA